MDAPNWQRIAELAATLLLVVIPWSFPSMGIAWRCVLWSLGWLLILHLIFALTPFLMTLHPFIKVGLAIGATGFLVAAVFTPILSAWHEEKASATEGDLTASESLPGIKPDLFAINIGPGGVSLVHFRTLREPIEMLGDKLSMIESNGKCLLSTVVRDRHGNLIVEVTRNHWRLSPTLSWDKNYKRDMLEVLDARGRVVLSLKLFTNGIELEGEWYHENGGGVRFVRARAPDGGGFWVMLGPQYPGDSQTIERRFVYPSKENWAQLAR